MVRKIIYIFFACALLCGAICTTASAKNYSVYSEGQVSDMHVSYFKDLASGIGFNDNYVAFRSDELSYTMIVGDLEYSDGVISLIGNGKEYVFTSYGSDINPQYRYAVNDITDSSVLCGDCILYSDVGDFPQLVERGAKYEILSLYLLVIACICIVINRIFFKR